MTSYHCACLCSGHRHPARAALTSPLRVSEPRSPSRSAHGRQSLANEYACPAVGAPLALGPLDMLSTRSSSGMPIGRLIELAHHSPRAGAILQEMIRVGISSSPTSRAVGEERTSCSTLGPVCGAQGATRLAAMLDAQSPLLPGHNTGTNAFMIFTFERPECSHRAQPQPLARVFGALGPARSSRPWLHTACTGAPARVRAAAVRRLKPSGFRARSVTVLFKPDPPGCHVHLPVGAVTPAGCSGDLCCMQGSTDSGRGAAFRSMAVASAPDRHERFHETSRSYPWARQPAAAGAA